MKLLFLTVLLLLLVFDFTNVLYYMIIDCRTIVCTIHCFIKTKYKNNDSHK